MPGSRTKAWVDFCINSFFIGAFLAVVVFIAVKVTDLHNAKKDAHKIDINAASTSDAGPTHYNYTY